ncbi:hypothetical protein ElyMa_001832200, partial [Elysia marginata]
GSPQRGGRRKQHQIETLVGHRPKRHHTQRLPPTLTDVRRSQLADQTDLNPTPDTPQTSDKSHHNQHPEYASCKVTYLNAQSVGNKTVTINNIITYKKSGLVFIIETWLAENGHILDWVVASETFAVSVDDLCLSDHYVINFRVALHLGQKKKKIATNRNTRSIDVAALNADIRADLEANQSGQGKGRADMFEDILRRNLENHAPLKTRVITDRQPAPWITGKV